MRRGLRVNFPGMVVLGTLFKCCWAHNDRNDYYALNGFQACTVSSYSVTINTACISQRRGVNGGCGCSSTAEFSHSGNSNAHTADGRAVYTKEMNNEKTGYCNKGYLYYSPGCSGGRWTIDVGKSPDDSGDSGCGNVAVSPVTTSATPRAGGWTVFCDGGNTTMTISGYNMATSDPPPACPTPAPFYSSVTFGDWVSMTQNGCGGQDYRALLVSSLACSAPSGCACAMDSAITLYDYNGQDVQLRDQAACTTTPKPCPSNVAYTYTWGDWYSTTGTACGGGGPTRSNRKLFSTLGLFLHQPIPATIKHPAVSSS